ncbi:putative RNA polymerase sigma factor [Serinicoccus hydrothermalis]|uniref:Putative RNA polymerase sigma factor n=1 Tax=Serinicoccus hydrothermalis TaxID=1758689 RepID=A0A1B1NAN6_9MICO|nr:sigma-70 family RNA polymerase sigma factor [Serinicoccus hydrothermalis]ANS78481.1 putative RNA polymerase sigma factor [Serinicoccus hydrothermalis]
MLTEDGPETGVQGDPPSLGDRAGACFHRYREGQDQALGELVELATPLLWNVARAHGCDREAAEDVVQDVWIRLVDRAADIRESGAVLGWLVIAVKRESWRTARVARRTSYDPTGTVDPGGTEAGPEAATILTERQQLLWGAVHDLSERCRQLLRIVAFCDRPDYDEVSAALGMPRGSIGPTRGRCLDKLRRSLAADERWEDR